MFLQKFFAIAVSAICVLFIHGCNCSHNGSGSNVNSSSTRDSVYCNPVLPLNRPDPSVILADDGYFYLYSTGTYVPIHRSADLVNWSSVGDAFTPDGKPSWNTSASSIWAPDINKIGDLYVMYYAMSKWGGIDEAGVGVAVAGSPSGPFADNGSLVVGNELGLLNLIDPFYIEENGKKYLFAGSFNGIYVWELTDDGLSVVDKEDYTLVAGTMMEGTYIFKKDGYYYLFGSNGSCCEGESSTYKVIVTRSKNLLGPYLNKDGADALTNNYTLVLQGNDIVKGPGHNAEFITDDNGDDWMLYHGYVSGHASEGRQVFLDKIVWTEDGWPQVSGLVPSASSATPVFSAGD